VLVLELEPPPLLVDGFEEQPALIGLLVGRKYFPAFFRNCLRRCHDVKGVIDSALDVLFCFAGLFLLKRFPPGLAGELGLAGEFDQQLFRYLAVRRAAEPYHMK
jgi:hypothetical protein